MGIEETAPIGSGRGGEGGGLKAADLADRLRRRILAEAMQPGADLPSEAELIQEYGLSRATVREAIRLLDAEGFIEVRRGRYGGVHVAHPGIERFRSWLAAQLTQRGTPGRALVELRWVMEPSAAELAAERITADQMDRLRALARSSDARAELEFHQVIAEASGNDLVSLIMRTVLSETISLPIHTPVRETDLDQSMRAHQRILRAIEDGDGEWAAEAMRRHLRAVQEGAHHSYRLDDPLLPPSHWA